MSLHKLPRGLLEIPKGTNTSCNDNSTFMNNLERTNTLLAQFVSATDVSKKLIMRQELEESYFHLTIYNLKESIKHKIEQDMWNNLFKKYISDLQNKIKTKDKLESSKAQSEISIFLDEAVGFYSKCIDTLSLVYNIRLPGGEGQHHISTKATNKISQEQEQATETDIRYIMQHCYVHMGDLSRYHNLSQHARFYYELAVQLDPWSGHAYNQLAILESAAMAHSAIAATNFRHVIRAILMYEYANTCRAPFPATRINVESLLRHVNEQSVSALLTSNSGAVGEQSGLLSMCVAWIHAYGHQRLMQNVHRCRQLQQRIVDWAGEMVKEADLCRDRWRELVSIAALHCSLLSSYAVGVEYTENKAWTANLHQFSQDFTNAVSRGLVSLSHDGKSMDDLLASPGCVSIIVVYLAWINRHADSATAAPLKVPFGEDFVRLINIIASKSTLIHHNDDKVDVDSSDIRLPLSLTELRFLTGFEPLSVPCAVYDIYASTSAISNSTSLVATNDTVTRIDFIVNVCRRLAVKWSSMLAYSATATADGHFLAVPPPEPMQKKHVKIEPSVVARKPVNNVALASMKHTKPNGFISGGGGGGGVRPSMTGDSPSSSEVTSATTTAAKGIITDVKIAKCIQEHIAQDSKTTSSTTTTTTATVSPRDELHHHHSVIAPAPGLILSSSLPPEYKSMSSSAAAIAEHGVGKASTTVTTALEQLQNSDSSQPLTAGGNNKNHNSSYNPNREQFEKDLPPRFANKRSFTQESVSTGGGEAGRSSFFDQQHNGGFTSMNYWDSINDFPNSSIGGGSLSGTGQHNSQQFDSKNLTKKESEMLLPPTVPTSWLTDDCPDHHGNVNVAGLKLDALMNNSPSMQYPFGNNMMQQQQQHSYNALQSPVQSQYNMMQQSFNQFQQQQPQLSSASLTVAGAVSSPGQVSSQSVAAAAVAASLKEQQDNQLQYLLQAVTTNATNTPRFRSQTDALLSAQMSNFDNQLSSYMQQQHHQQQQQQQRLAPKFHAIPPPSQPQPSMNANHNYEAFPLGRSSFYDKPVFSSTSSSQSAGYGYSSASSMMPQQHHHSQPQQQQPMMMQQQQQQQQVRHNNPLLNLLPGYMNNEAQR